MIDIFSIMEIPLEPDVEELVVEVANVYEQIGHRRVKRSYVTRVVPEQVQLHLGPASSSPRRGDLVMARVTRLAAHSHLEDPHGRRVRLYEGDVIVGAYGDRYATDFYEGYAQPGRYVHLLTAGGLIGTVASAHNAVDAPTVLEVMGSVVDDGAMPLSLDRFARSAPVAKAPPLGTIVVVGSGMNAGKTTTVVSTVRGLVRTGIRVGAGKVTGSGSGKDRWSYVDAGADVVLDFLDFGMSSTFGYPLPRLEETLINLRSALVEDGAEAAVLEIADGILQEETGYLLSRLQPLTDAVVFAAVDALSAHGGVEILRSHGLPVRAISGLVTRSPLASREIVANMPVLSPADLAEGGALALLQSCVPA